jgi:hypothetical protein
MVKPGATPDNVLQPDFSHYTLRPVRIHANGAKKAFPDFCFNPAP